MNIINSSNSTFNDIFDKNKIIKKYELFKKVKIHQFYLFVILTTSIFLKSIFETYG